MESISPLRSLLDELESDLKRDAPETLRDWAIEEFREFNFPQINSPLSPAIRYRMGRVGQQPRSAANQLPVDVREDAFTAAAWLCAASGLTNQALATGEEALRLPGDQPGAAFLMADLRYRTDGNIGAPPIDECVHMEMARHHISSVSLAVHQKAKVVLARGYGLANVELRSSIARLSL